MRVLAFDLSLTSTGWAGDEGHGVIESGLSGLPRLQQVRDLVLDRASISKPDLLVIEGYSFASVNQAHHVGELGGVVRLTLWEAGYALAEVAPKSMKKYATTKGNADKFAVFGAAVRRGAEVEGPDEADAWWLWVMGKHYLGDPVFPPTALMEEVLGQVSWPKV